MSRSVPSSQLVATRESKGIPGPGRYETSSSFEKHRPQNSPAFADGDERMKDSSNGIPGPADYLAHGDLDRAQSVLSTRYVKFDNWQRSSETCAPSPEKYTINRDLGGRTTKLRPLTRKPNVIVKEDLGPGSYETNISSFGVHSYNANVPGAFPSAEKK